MIMVQVYYNAPS